MQQDEQERLRAENEALRQQNQQLWSANQQKKSSKAVPIIACAVIAAVGIFIIIPIMAAIALPMYSTFKQKSRASAVVKVTDSLSPALMSWHDDHGTFEGASVDSNGGAITMNGTRTGAGLPEIPNVNWSISGTQDQLILTADFVEGCPACDTVFTINAENGNFKTDLMVGDESDPLGFNR